MERSSFVVRKSGFNSLLWLGGNHNNSMKFTKEVSEWIDLSNAHFEETENSIIAEINTEKVGRHKLCSVNKRTGKIQNIDVMQGRSISASEFANAIKLVDKTMRKAGFAGVIEDREIENRLEKIENKIGKEDC